MQRRTRAFQAHSAYAYYGTADATILYLIVLHNAWCCTGDAEILKHFLPVAEKCLAWIDDYGDRDGDGFQEYQTRSKVGYANQGWIQGRRPTSSSAIILSVISE